LVSSLAAPFSKTDLARPLELSAAYLPSPFGFISLSRTVFDVNTFFRRRQSAGLLLVPSRRSTKGAAFTSAKPDRQAFFFDRLAFPFFAPRRSARGAASTLMGRERQAGFSSHLSEFM
jgi:hypothetical protein